tara:strand:- start:892 stop:1101 length:210 start_codon:yes stop_codon:yes gene_type:complete
LYVRQREIMTKSKEKSKANKKLTERINLRVSEKELALLESACSADERSLSNWARRVLVQEARRQLSEDS